MAITPFAIVFEPCYNRPGSWMQSLRWILIQRSSRTCFPERVEGARIQNVVVFAGKRKLGLIPHSLCSMEKEKKLLSSRPKSLDLWSLIGRWGNVLHLVAKPHTLVLREQNLLEDRCTGPAVPTTPAFHQSDVRIGLHGSVSSQLSLQM